MLDLNAYAAAGIGRGFLIGLLRILSIFEYEAQPSNFRLGQLLDSCPHENNSHANPTILIDFDSDQQR